MVNLVYLCIINSADMKTQYVNIGQALSGIHNLMIASMANIDWNKFFSAFKLSPGKAGSYLFPLLKQLFRETLMGSEAEMEMVLLFVKNYFLLIAFTISQIALTLRFKKLTGSINKSATVHRDKLYQHKQTAGNWSGQILIS
jgi:hypothetical protein